MRKFDKKRLYKLTRAVVLIASVFLLFSAVMNQIATMNVYPKAVDNDCEYLKGDNDLDIDMYIECRQLIMTQWSEARARVVDHSLLGLALPIMFYSGVFTYRYLFPKK
ncbi:MAG TPA: hypothetical protein PLS49_07095 [Candidatus Woesebacteria bacterium]|nr:hypothetical protein [Candidatus Woesebacteria bacterium]